MEARVIEAQIVRLFKSQHPHLLVFDIEGFAERQAPVIRKMSHNEPFVLINIGLAIEHAAAIAEKQMRN